MSDTRQGWVAVGDGAVLFLNGTPLQVRAANGEAILAVIAELRALTDCDVQLGPLARDEHGRVVGSVAAERRNGTA